MKIPKISFNLKSITTFAVLHKEAALTGLCAFLSALPLGAMCCRGICRKKEKSEWEALSKVNMENRLYYEALCEYHKEIKKYDETLKKNREAELATKNFFDADAQMQKNTMDFPKKSSVFEDLWNNWPGCPQEDWSMDDMADMVMSL